MKFWLITDTHLGHSKMKEYCGRPDGFEENILSNLNNIVNVGDILIHLGDVCFGNDAGWNEQIQMATSGSIRWLIKGNHDKKTDTWYHENGWAFVGETAMVKKYGLKILLSHRPQPYSDYYDINIHGHLHNTNHHKELTSYKHIRFFIEQNYSPIDLRKIVKK